MTFSGHKVYRTLIRCHFSPQDSTNKRYVYTGSSNGQIHIYDIFENSQVAVLKNEDHQSIIRDCAWHPSKTSIIFGTTDNNYDSDQIFHWEYAADAHTKTIKTKDDEVQSKQSTGDHLQLKQQ